MAGAVLIAPFVAACAPSAAVPPTAPVEAPPVSTTQMMPTGDENTYLQEVREILTTHSPAVLLSTGYRVCAQVQKGWDYRFIREDVDAALWPPTEPRPTSYLIPDYANYRDDQLAAIAMQHLCGMSDVQMMDYFRTHGSAE